MLALALAATYPGSVSGLVLVGCGTFDSSSRVQLERTLRERVTPAIADRLRLASSRIADADVRLCVTARLLEPLYSCELSPHRDETLCYDSRGQREAWRDMLALQRNGTYPAAFARITEPVLMIHGDADPHPGPMIRDGLLPVLPQLEYVQLSRCGHYPWLERYARDEFFTALVDWLCETNR
jgi:pimeloyl-ACP methyl ester carboxylesterase